ncbi:MAG TPA: DUF1592 domain-containing protein [Polyangia bacterium]
MSLAAVSIAIAGCQGSIGGPGGSEPGGSTNPGGSNNPGSPGSTGPGSTPGGNPSSNTPADPNAAGPMPLTRLTRREYNNTVRDLFNDNTNPANALPDDHDGDFLYRRFGIVTSQDATTLRDAAEAVAGNAVKNNFAAMVPCDTSAANEQTCIRSFVQNFGLKIYRRPVAAAEADALMALYQTGRTTLTLTVTSAVSLLLEAMLQAPEFLYHWELGPNKPTMEGSVVKLGSYENAARLSYFIWGSMPDQALFDAAAMGKLSAQADLESQATRMLADTKARATVQEFVQEWMSLDQVSDRPKDMMVYPQFNDALKTAMNDEANAFVSNVVFDGDGLLKSLLTANYSYLEASSAAVYGVSGVSGTTAARTSLDSTQRAGILTQLGFLSLTGATNGSDPVKRGHKVYERFLCGVLPPPPANVPPAKPASAGGTTRDRYKDHDSNACAIACHSNMDPIGFAFENYDGIGAYRTTDNNLPVDATGSIQLDGAKKTFNDAIGLTQLLANSNDVRNCFATQVARFAYKRVDTDADRASIEGAVGEFNKGGDAVRSLLVGVAGSRSFRYRSLAAGEMN